MERGRGEPKVRQSICLDSVDWDACLAGREKREMKCVEKVEEGGDGEIKAGRDDGDSAE
jgi:hypothetical protein